MQWVVRKIILSLCTGGERYLEFMYETIPEKIDILLFVMRGLAAG